MKQNGVVKGKKILITGGAGFIASHLIGLLVDDNQIVIYDNFLRDSIHYTQWINHPNLCIVKGDVLDASLLGESMRNVDICLHAAAIAGIYSVGVNATLTMKVNFLGTFNALEAAFQNKVKRFIDFSTSEVYGPFVYRGQETDPTTLGPVGERRWVYAISKLAGEHFAHGYGHDFDLEVVTVRPFNVYGPRQVGEGAIHHMIVRALKGEDLTVYNDGSQIRSWCFVSDFVDGLYKSLATPKAAGEVFNLGNPQATITVYRLAELIIELTGSSSKIVFKPHPGSEVEMRIPNIDKARNLLNYNPQVSLLDGLKKTINWYKDNRGSE